MRALTNETGTITDTLVFDAFGNETAKTGSTDNSYGFQGEEQDSTGLYYLRARYVDPATGAFTSMDTYGGSLSDPMSLHKYMFANANPVKYSDPSGHAVSLVESMAVGSIISVLSYSVTWGVTALFDKSQGTNYAANYSLKGLILSTIFGALLGGFGWGFSTVFQALSLTVGQYIGLSVFCFLLGLDLKVWAYFEGKSGDFLWSSILNSLGDVSWVASGAAAGGAASTTKTNPLGNRDYGNGNTNASGNGDCLREDSNSSVPKSHTEQGISDRGFRPQPGERTLDGFVRRNASPEVSLRTKSSGFNNNNGNVGGVFKRFGGESHGGLSPHVHQPQRNVAPNGNIYGSVGTKTINGGVTSPSPKDASQLYDYIYNGKYH